MALSVSAFTARTMDVKGVKSFAELSKFTPGVTYDQERHDVSIRGIISKAGSGPTGVYIDDTPIQARALGLNANNTLPAPNNVPWGPRSTSTRSRSNTAGRVLLAFRPSARAWIGVSSI